MDDPIGGRASRPPTMPSVPSALDEGLDRIFYYCIELRWGWLG